MKKIILIGLLSLMSSVYALEVVSAEKTKEETSQKVEKVEKVEEVKANNNTYLYEFDLSSVGQADKSIHKYMTNNLDTVSTVDGLRDVMFKNWKLGKEYSKNLTFKTSKVEGEKLVCKYNNGLVIKVKNYGNYDKNCPLKD